MPDHIPPSPPSPSAGSTLPTQYRNHADLTTASQLDGGSLSDSPQQSHSPDSTHSLPPLPTLPGYTLISLLGSGGTSEVYEALDGIGNRFALKRPRERSISTPGLERFEREARAMSALDHPNVAPLCYWGCHQFVPYYTMPIYPGGSMADRLGYYRDNLREAVALLADVADALYHVHSKRLLHRDLKPHNILLDAEGRPAIADFGLVREIDGSTATVTTARLGTPAYMSPEQARGEHRTLIPQTDIWSFGVILYEVLTGQRPFAGEDADTVILGILTLPVPHPTTVLAGADRGLCRIVGNCLQKDPKGRYPCASQLRDDLRRWLDGSKVPSRRVSRQFRRYRLPAVSFAAVMVLAVLLMPGVVGGDPRAEVDPTMELLGRREAAVVVGESGQPRLPLKVADGVEFHRTGLSEAGFTARSAKDSTMLRVASQPNAARWEFRAEVRLSDQELGCNSGIYFGYKNVRTPHDATMYGLFSWTDPPTPHQFKRAREAFEQDQKMAPDPASLVPPEAMVRAKSQWRLELKLTAKTAGIGMYSQPLVNIGNLFDGAPQSEARDKWRRLRMVTTPERIDLYIDEAHTGPVDRPLVMNGPNSFEKLFGSGTLDLARGDFGLFFRYCTIEIKNAVVEVLPDPAP